MHTLRIQSKERGGGAERWYCSREAPRAEGTDTRGEGRISELGQTHEEKFQNFEGLVDQSAKLDVIDIFVHSTEIVKLLKLSILVLCYALHFISI